MDKTTDQFASLISQHVFIVWKPGYDLGIPILDDQHRGIVSTINSLHFCMKCNHAHTILRPIIHMIYDYTLVHFKMEELFLSNKDFPGAQEHQALHEKLTVRLNQVGRDTLLNHDPLKFLGFLKEWWVHHILHEDLLFRDLLLTK